MAVGQRLSKVARECNVGISTIVEFLHKKGIELDMNPNTKVSEDTVELLKKEFKQDHNVKKASEELIDRKQKEKKEAVSIENVQKAAEEEVEEDDISIDEIVGRAKKSVDVKVVGKIDLDKPKPKEAEPRKEEKPVEEPVKAKDEPAKVKEAPEQPKAAPAAEAKKEVPVAKETPAEEVPAKKEEKTPEHIPVNVDKAAESPKVVGKIDLDSPAKKSETKSGSAEKAKSAEPVKEEKPKAKEEKPKEKPVDPKPVAEAPKAPAQAVKGDEPKSQAEKDQAKADKGQNEGRGKEDFMPTQVRKLSGPTVVGKIDLPMDSRNGAESKEDRKSRRKKRKRIKKEKEKVNIPATGTAGDKPVPHKAGDPPRPQTGKPGDKRPGQPGAANAANKKKVSKVKKRPARPEVSEEDVARQIKDTLARLTTKSKSKASRHRRDKRDVASQRHQADLDRQDEEKKVLKVTEFVTANEMANMMDIPVTQIIASCMSLGLFVSINQRLDAETIALVSEEFGYKVEFVSLELIDSIQEEEDDPATLKDRPAIVTVMGHVDHGKTSLLDFIRKADVAADEAGGITQHIGAYSVKLENDRQITFLDTPGHEAFTAMRARGAQVTDIAIIIIAANDSVMPQTVEAINHASAAGVPIVFAISKIDLPGANPDKVRESLANMNYLVEDWGGKYQCQEVSAKHGTNVKDLLEKVLLEADMLELKANPDKGAVGSVIESTLDKGRGYVATLLVQAGRLKVGDLILSGSYYGHVKAMFNERNQKVESVGPSEPVLILGLNGAPQAGEKFHVMENEKEVKDIANKRQQLQREQGMRAQKHITLDEIGRRIAIGNFQELNLIVKGDVDGSIEALADSLIKLSTEEIQVNVIHKAVGGISESDIMLAAASNAIVIGFQVRPSLAARRIAEKEQIDVRLYSIIYDAIEEIKAAMEGMLSPEIKETIVSTVEVREVFKITKVGTVAGCMVKEGKIKRNSKIRLIRDGIVIYTGDLGSLKRFKDDVKEVASGFECGLNINNFNDIKEGDIIEAYEETEVSRKL
ncbi:translation initiation factor IF-2 [Geofilum rubicundum]|uniref:Translation initiation factor IF-2 n=1 Tax=Geofilum rubicundum JCM 15548 TaxID=1236989 RepID=A0A0E9LQY8_9BACT|nr:translation initiation factor IF-2 [Geofilum rubicundum]GAO27987.1 translation initiation factor 2 [Geofilum rubicundum JCM 15548]